MWLETEEYVLINLNDVMLIQVEAMPDVVEVTDEPVCRTMIYFAGDASDALVTGTKDYCQAVFRFVADSIASEQRYTRLHDFTYRPKAALPEPDKSEPDDPKQRTSANAEKPKSRPKGSTNRKKETGGEA